jgi:hypothetical protein
LSLPAQSHYLSVSNLAATDPKLSSDAILVLLLIVLLCSLL